MKKRNNQDFNFTQVTYIDTELFEIIKNSQENLQYKNKYHYFVHCVILIKTGYNINAVLKLTCLQIMIKKSKDQNL